MACAGNQSLTNISLHSKWKLTDNNTISKLVVKKKKKQEIIFLAWITKPVCKHLSSSKTFLILATSLLFFSYFPRVKENDILWFISENDISFVLLSSHYRILFLESITVGNRNFDS